MVRMRVCGLSMVCVIAAMATEADATPYSLPGLGLTIELPASPSWGPGTSKYGGADMLQSHTELRVQVDMLQSPSSCLQWAEGAIRVLLAQGATTRFVPRPAWIPAAWFPAISELALDDGLKQLSWCRDLGTQRADGGATGEPSSIVVVALVERGADADGLVGSVMSALEAQLVRNGVPTVRTEYSDAQILDGLNEDLERRRSRVTTASPADEPRVTADEISTAEGSTAGASTYRRDREDRDERPTRRARYDGVRLAVDVATLSLEGDAVEGGRVGASLALPARYRRSDAEMGWAYGGRVAAGRAGDVVVGSGHGAIGLAIGKPRTQLALLMVVGGDRAPAGSPLAAQDGGFAGLQATLRMPLTLTTDLEATGTMVAGSHGRGSWLELSLVSVRCAPVTCVLGIERRTWDDGMSSLGAQLGIGY